MKQIYNEQEASESLGISLSTLHAVLEQHIFNDGIPRPPRVEFTSADLLMIRYWAEKIGQQKIVNMPRRD